ncbi:Uncharacterised protein [Mycobacterium tuberculosis]|uniref:Uncharacterized protein n=1 Tax=Mycobacterium tuberculosis TaxID=1773 RepID=A0A916LDN4_MYCTX|nr:Uncharacterised protein [Mycobacterium tuberculosis]COY46078.1 Uncharacterised protein [Mycobacterium tuberculosis]COY66124.1 Uncharacterised protein [Mycobacterium tuberculosis]
MGVRQEASGSCESSQSRVGLREKHDWLGVQSQLPRYGGGPIGVMRGGSPCGHGAAHAGATNFVGSTPTTFNEKCTVF